MERFLGTCCLLHEYFLKESSSHIRGKFSDQANFPSPRSNQGKNLSVQPGWLPSIADAFPQLHQKLKHKYGRKAKLHKSTRGAKELQNNLTGTDAFYARSTCACMGSKSSKQSLVSFQLAPYQVDEGAEASGGITSSILSEVVANEKERASMEAINGKRTSIIDSYQMNSTNEEKQDNGVIADSQLEVCSLFSEQAVATMNEFLLACNKALQGLRDVDEEAGLADEGEGEVVFCLHDLLASELSPALQARFGTNTLLAMVPSA